MKRLPLALYALCLFALLVVPAARAQEADDDEKQSLTPEQMAELLHNVEPAFVRVEYTLQYDRGEPPFIRRNEDGSRHIKEQRPLETFGMLIDKNTVVSLDLAIHPRFIKALHVRHGQELIPAQLDKVAFQQCAIYLKLEQPFTSAKPLEFDLNAEKPFYLVDRRHENGQWCSTIKPFSRTLKLQADGSVIAQPGGTGVIVNEAGQAVTISFDDPMSLDDTWKVPPTQWYGIERRQYADTLQKAEDLANQTLVRVTLNLRSPKSRPENPAMTFSQRRRDDESPTERNVVGVIVGPQQILVLEMLNPTETARLERITIHQSNGQTIDAEFAATLKDYGAFVAMLAEPVNTYAELSPTPVLQLQAQPLWAARVLVKGEDRTTDFSHNRIRDFKVGFRRQILPQPPNDADSVFYFDATAQRLAALPMVRRERIVNDDRWDEPAEMLIAGTYLNAILANLADHVDPSNIPLGEEQEDRLAWMGVELQPLDRELARINNVADITSDGETGAIVSYVYPNSPAAQAGIEPGMVLVRLYVDGEPEPYEVQIQSTIDQMGGFPWDRLDSVPEQYYDRIPLPWPSAENQFTRALTDLGFGIAYTAEFYQNGEKTLKDFEVTVSPAHYDSAPRYKATDLGMTVRNMTYEVQRYFQKQPDKPGVIVSKVEPGEKASIAGIKPYEIVTHVNDAAVHTVDDFERLIQNQQELKISIKRLHQGRVVKIKMGVSDSNTDSEQ